MAWLLVMLAPFRRKLQRSCWDDYWPILNLLPAFVSKLNPCTRRKQAHCYWTLHTNGCTLAGRFEPKPIWYCTYHCVALNPLICCQTGRPGRKPWKGSCVDHNQGQRETETRKSWNNERTLRFTISHVLPTNVSSHNFCSSLCNSWLSAFNKAYGTFK